MRSRLVGSVIVLAVALAAALHGAAMGSSGDQKVTASDLRKRMSHHQRAEASDSVAQPQPPSAKGLKIIGKNNFGKSGFNSDVWSLRQTSYVGTWGVFGVACPNDGTKVIDISTPSSPQLVDLIPAPPGTQTNDVKARRVNTGSFEGDVLVVSNEDCDPSGGARGFEVWDVTDPANAQFLSRFGPVHAVDEEPFLSQIGFGVHNTFIYKQGGRVFVFTVVDFAEIFQFLNGVPRQQMVGDLRIVEITDPTNPVQIADWGAIKNLGLNPFTTGPPGDDDPFSFLHDVWVKDDIAYLSWWDAGLILLDVSDPSDPQFLGRLTYPAGAEGNTHVAVPVKDGAVTAIGDEDFEPHPWGFLRTADTSDPTNMSLLGRFLTRNARRAPPPDGDFTIHNVVTRGNRVYASWYSDGVRIFNVKDPTKPRQIAFLVPPARPDPFGVLATAAQVWGVKLHKKLILASDMNAGLYVLKRT